MTLDEINALPEDDARSEFLRCCGSLRWATTMAARRPYRGLPDLFEASDSVCKELTPKDWKEAFSHHPKIGDANALRVKLSSREGWASKEQSGVRSASDRVLQELAKENRNYEKRFGYIFIVCATGKSAEEMLVLLRSRLGNEPEKEILIAAEEQRKIAAIRLERLVQTE